MSVACTPALTQDTASHLWMPCKPLPTKVKTGLAGIRGNGGSNAAIDILPVAHRPDKSRFAGTSIDLLISRAGSMRSELSTCLQHLLRRARAARREIRSAPSSLLAPARPQVSEYLPRRASGGGERPSCEMITCSARTAPNGAQRITDLYCQCLGSPVNQHRRMRS
jgi:hypothetical protein